MKSNRLSSVMPALVTGKSILRAFSKEGVHGWGKLAMTRDKSIDMRGMRR